MQIYRIKSRYDNKLNAKDLALAKINAGPKTFGFYAYGISLGIDIRDLAKIINTPLGRAISKMCEGNVFNGQMGTFSALLAIKKLEGENLFRDLNQFNVHALSKVSDDNVDSSNLRDNLLIDNEPVYTAYDTVLELFREYYNINILNNPKAMQRLLKKPFVKKIDAESIFSASLSDMLFNISIIGQINDCINFVTNPETSEVFKTILPLLLEFSNAREFEASIYQLLEYCGNYGNLVDTYYQTEFVRGDDGKWKIDNYLARDLKILAQGAEEMRVLGTLLSSNKGVKSRTEQGTTFIKTLENAIIDRKEVLGLKASPDDKIDYTLFCLDSKYREDAINRYELVKHSINILDVIATAPHFLSYIRTCNIPYAAFKAGSAKFRARDKYYDTLIDKMKITKSSDKDKVIRGLENAVNFRALKEWAALLQLLFFLPKGSKLFVGRNLEPITTVEDLYVPLSDSEGNGFATFKYYMENTIIPNMQKDMEFVGGLFVPGIRGSYSLNPFVAQLTPIELTKTGTHAAISAYTMGINMMPRNDEQELQLDSVKSGFAEMYSQAFPKGNDGTKNIIPSYADAFYIYSLYVFGGRKGPSSLMALFDNNDCEFANSFRTFEADLDMNGDYDFELRELYKWCAPDSNTYNPSATYYYATTKEDFGKLFYMLEKVDKEDQEAQEESSKIATKKLVQINESLEPINRNSYMNPLTEDRDIVENSHRLGLNTNILDAKYLNNIIIDENIPDESFSIIPNYDSGEFSIVTNGILSPENLAVVKLIEKHLKDICQPVPDLNSGEYYLTIPESNLRALLEESINEVQKNCG